MVNISRQKEKMSVACAAMSLHVSSVRKSGLMMVCGKVFYSEQTSFMRFFEKCLC